MKSIVGKIFATIICVPLALVGAVLFIPFAILGLLFAFPYAALATIWDWEQ